MARARVALGAAALAGVMLAAGCGSEGTPKTGASADSLSGRTLVVASWGGSWTKYAKEFFYDPFAKDTGVKVVVATPGKGFASQVAAQQSAGNVQWDLLDAPGSDTPVMDVKGQLELYPQSLVSTIAPLVTDGSLRPDANKTTYLEYGQTADLIVCNPKRVSKCPTNPKEFFDVANFPGRRGVTVAAGVAAMAFALEADGVPADQLFPLDIPRAIKKLKEIKPSVAVWAATASQSQQTLASGEVDIAFMANGRAHLVKKDTIPDLKFFWEGALLFDEGWCVPKGAPNKDVAFAFIEWFAKHPQQQAKFTEALTYMTPTKDLASLIPDETKAALPIDKPGVVQMDERKTADQLTDIGKAMQEFLVG